MKRRALVYLKRGLLLSLTGVALICLSLQAFTIIERFGLSLPPEQHIAYRTTEADSEGVRWGLHDNGILSVVYDDLMPYSPRLLNQGNAVRMFGFGWGFDYWEVRPGGVQRMRAVRWIDLPLWAAGVACAIYPVTVVISAHRRLRREKNACCLSCGYDLTGNTSGVCPECGVPT